MPTRKGFDRFVQPKPCGVCKKLTTYSLLQGLDSPLCQRHYDAAGYENEHLDGGHEEAKYHECPMCYPEEFPEWK